MLTKEVGIVWNDGMHKHTEVHNLNKPYVKKCISILWLNAIHFIHLKKYF